MLPIAFAPTRNWAGGLLSIRRTGAAVAAWWLRMQERKARHATARILSSLSDRTLADIGISRDEITSISFCGSDDRWPRRFTSGRTTSFL